MLYAFLIFAIVPAKPKPAWTAKVGTYHFVKWPQNGYANDIERLFVKDRLGRMVTSITDHKVTPIFDEKFEPRDLNHDGVPEIVLSSWTGGAHGSSTYYVWSLGPHPKCLLAYDKNNIADGHDFEFVDLDGDGIPEIRSWYDGFAYTVGGSYWRNLPIVLKLVGDKYVDRTSSFPKITKLAAASAWKEFHRADRMKEPRSWSGTSCSAINLIALADIMKNRAGTWKRLKRELPAQNYRWLRDREWAILGIIRGRSRRYAYPTPYNPVPVKFRRLSERFYTAFGP